MVLCLHQSNAYIKKKLRVWRDQKWIPFISAKTSRTCAGLETTPPQVSQYKAENGNLRKSGSTFRHDTVFTLLQCLYQKEATGMDSQTIRSSSWCKNQSYLCGTANSPVSCKPVYGREQKFAEIRVYFSPWYRLCTKAMFICKGTYRYGESKNAFL